MDSGPIWRPGSSGTSFLMVARRSLRQFVLLHFFSVVDLRSYITPARRRCSDERPSIASSELGALVKLLVGRAVRTPQVCVAIGIELHHASCEIHDPDYAVRLLSHLPRNFGDIELGCATSAKLRGDFIFVDVNVSDLRFSRALRFWSFSRRP